MINNCAVQTVIDGWIIELSIHFFVGLSLEIKKWWVCLTNKKEKFPQRTTPLSVRYDPLIWHSNGEITFAVRKGLKRREKALERKRWVFLWLMSFLCHSINQVWKSRNNKRSGVSLLFLLNNTKKQTIRQSNKILAPNIGPDWQFGIWYLSMHDVPRQFEQKIMGHDMEDSSLFSLDSCQFSPTTITGGEKRILKK